MKNTIRLDSRLTSKGVIETSKAALRDYYRKLKKKGSKDKEVKINVNLILYPKFFLPEDNKTGKSGYSSAAKLQNTSIEAVEILEGSQGTIKNKDFARRLSQFSRLK